MNTNAKAKGLSPTAQRSIAFSAAVFIAALASSPAAAEGPPVGTIAIRLALRNSNGQVGCSLYGSEKGYPKDPTAALQTKWCAVAGSASVCRFDAVVAGTYAVACFHDENKNGKLDTGLFGIPSEGVAASNDAKGTMGPPSFKDAKFAFAGRDQDLVLKMRY